MTEEQIKQNADVYANSIDRGRGFHRYLLIREAHIEGAHSRDEEVASLLSQLEDKDGYIAHLREELDKLLNSWISVEDRLPKKTKGVFSCQVRELEKDKIVYYKDERGYIHTGYLNANNHWRDLDRDNTAIYTVTHWMPIPELKKGE